MGVQLNLKDIQSGFLSASAFNSNNTLIEQALNKALDRTGASDNAMEVNLDMGQNRIFNVGDALFADEAINLGQAGNLITASSSSITSTSDRDIFTANAGQTLFNLTNINYVTGTNALIVFVNGVYQISGTDYTETSQTSITFNAGLENGDVVVIIGARFDSAALFTVTSDEADRAEQEADRAATEATNAETSATNSFDSATEAENWANNPEDVLVPEGDLVDDYSALHWARKSEQAAGYKLGINTQSVSTYNLAASDEGDLVRMTNAGDNTVVVPDNATVPFEIGTIVNVRQSGTGTTTISPAAGVTINAPNDEFSTDGEEFGIGLVKVGTNEWDLVKSYAGVRVDQFDADITPITGASGYQKLPTGLILQWGSVTVGDDAVANVTFPIPFTNACINASATLGRAVGDKTTDAAVGVGSLTTTGMQVGNWFFSTSTVYWFAIGF